MLCSFFAPVLGVGRWHSAGSRVGPPVSACASAGGLALRAGPRDGLPSIHGGAWPLKPALLDKMGTTPSRRPSPGGPAMQEPAAKIGPLGCFTEAE